jgi:hypothetical protein
MEAITIDNVAVAINGKQVLVSYDKQRVANLLVTGKHAWRKWNGTGGDGELRHLRTIIQLMLLSKNVEYPNERCPVYTEPDCRLEVQIHGDGSREYCLHYT